MRISDLSASAQNATPPAGDVVRTSGGDSGAAAQGPLWARPAMRAVSGGIFRPGGLTLTERIATRARVLPGWRVLDVGCGTGATVRHLRQRYGAAAVGMDALPAQVQAGQWGSAPSAVAGVAEHPPFLPGSFQMVLCECVLSLLPDTDATLAALHALLEPGGLLAVTDLYLRQDAKGTGAERTAAAARASGSCLGWGADRAAIEAYLHRAGFVLCCFEDHSALLGELAARLVLAGESPCLLASGGCGAPGFGAVPGYFLLLARRVDTEAPCHTSGGAEKTE